MKKFNFVLPTLSLLLLLLLSCTFSSNRLFSPAPSATPEAPPNWWMSWLAKPECKPPCWKNITPGITTMDEAASILENSSEIKIDFRSKGGIDWTFNQNKDEGGTLKASQSQDGIVAVIWIESISNRKLLLKTIVASYNNPEYVKPYDCREGKCVTALIYPDLGMFLSVFVDNTRIMNDPPQFEILPDTIVDRVYFIESGMENSKDYLDSQDNLPMMEWKGYGEYP